MNEIKAYKVVCYLVGASSVTDELRVKGASIVCIRAPEQIYIKIYINDLFGKMTHLLNMG